MTAQEGNLSGLSEIGGASESVPQLEIFTQNLERFRGYATSRGAYFDARGFLIYRGKVLSRAEDEYLAESEVAFQRPLEEGELEAAFENLLDYAGVQEDEGDE